MVEQDMDEPGIYAVGDIQGCLQPLRRLIHKSPIDLERDQLWFAGDLVNRGPQSLDSLRYIKALSEQMGERLKVVLGNHDLHLLALAHGVRKTTLTPGMAEILEASDRIDLLEWLRHQSLLVRDTMSKSVLVHAGVYPAWRIKQAAKYAREVESILHGPDFTKLLRKMYGVRPTRWSDDLQGWERYRFIINAMTRMRFCTRNGGLNFSYAGAPGVQSKSLYPWYQLPVVPRKNWRIIFGHWSSAGAWFDGNHIALDSGCVWGEDLTMARVDLRKIVLYKTSCKYG
jgi:bis(5'-nucleosyl)-tetraphosphatase (symmetrical)